MTVLPPRLFSLERTEVAGTWTAAAAQTAGTVYDVKALGAQGDGVSHPLSERYPTLAAARVDFPLASSLSDERDWAAIQKALAAASASAGATVYVPEGDYVCARYLHVTGPNVQLVGVAGRSHIRWREFSPFTRQYGFWRSVNAGIIADVDNFAIRGIKLSGPRRANTYVANDTLISVCGRSSRERRQRLTVADCELSMSGAYAIQAQFASDIVIDHNHIHHCGYCGIELCSCDNGHVYRNRIRTIHPGTRGNMYGVVLDHDSTSYATDPNAGTKQAGNPFCERCVVFDNEVEDIAWEGIDMHGGFENQVIHNRVYNTKQGISCGSGSGAAQDYAGHANLVAFNLIDSRKSDGSPAVPGRANAQYGINANGGARAKNDGVKILWNRLIQKGIVGDSSTGAIQVTFCINGQVIGNTLEAWGGVGILCNEGSANVDISSNQFLDLVAPTDEVATAIYTSARVLPSLAVTRNTLYSKYGRPARTGFSGAQLTSRPRLSDNDFSIATVAPFVLPSFGFLVGTDGPVVVTANDGDATPSVAEARGAAHVVLLVPARERSYAITDFDAGDSAVAEGTCIEVVNTGTVNVTLERRRSVLAGGVEWVGKPRDTIVLRKIGSHWHELSRSSNR